MYEVITLVGSTRIGKPIWEKIEENLTLNGNIVLTVNVWGMYDFLHHEDGKQMMFMFDKMMKQKIDMSDRICVLVKDNRIGESSKKYIKYARKCLLPVDFIEIKGEGYYR